MTSYDELMKQGSELINNIVSGKYLLEGETDYIEDVVNRRFRKELEHLLPSKDFEKIMSALISGRITPAGSIIYGLGNYNVSCSLSNCYFVPIESDSIEGIFDAQKHCAETFKARGGCVCRDSVVISRQNGLQKIQDIEEGQYILSFNTDTEKDEFRKVIKTHQPIVKKDQNVEVVTESGTRLITSQTHPTLVFRNDMFQYIPTRDVTSDDFVLRTPDLSEFSENNTIHDPEVGWWTGFHVGDGASFTLSRRKNQQFIKDYKNLGFNRNAAGLRVMGDNVEVLENYARIFNERTNSNVSVSSSKNKNGTMIYTISTSSYAVNNMINAYIGCYGFKALSVEVPTWIFNSSYETKVAFLAGLIDSDGHVDGKRSKIEFNTSSKKLADTLQLLINTLGQRSNRTSVEGYSTYIISNCNKMYRINIFRTHLINDLLSYIYHPIKNEKLLTCNGTNSQTVPIPNHLHEIIKEIKVPWQASCYQLRYSFLYNPDKSIKKRVSKEKFNKLMYKLVYYSNSHQRSLIKYYWNLCNSLEPVKSVNFNVDVNEQFYDLTVENNNNYYAGLNGLSVIHNSGFDISILRSKNTKVRNSAQTSSGAVSFLPNFDKTVHGVGQNGRRGAALASIDIRHPDSLDFIYAKATPSKVFEIDPITGEYDTINHINLSVKIPNSFMEAVKNDQEWQFYFPDIKHEKYDTEWDGDFDKWISKGYPVESYGYINARELLNHIAEAAWICGDPGVIFIDQVKEYSTGYFDEKLTPFSVNPCLPEWAPVLTPQGYKRFGNVQNRILFNGSIYECSDLFKTRDYDDVYEVELESGMKLYATRDHEIAKIQNITKNKNGKIIDFISQKTPLSELQINDVLKTDYTPIEYERNENEYKNGLISGMVYGDGSIASNYFRILIGENELNQEQEIYDLITSHLDDQIGNSFGDNPGLSNKCKAFNVGTRKALNKFFDFFGAKHKDNFILEDKSISFILGFTDGLIAADGSVSCTKVHKEVSIQQHGDRGYQILSSLQLHLASLGIYTNLQIGSRNGTNYCATPQTKWKLTIPDVKTFSKHITLFHEQKRQRIETILSDYGPQKDNRITAFKFRGQRIVNIRKLDEQYPVYDISVPGPNVFVSSCAVVSNCAEQPLAKWNNCLLSVLVLYKYVSNPFTENAEFDVDQFLEDAKYGIRFLDACSDVNIDKHPLKQQREMDAYGKRVGQEITGLADMLAMLGYKYGSDEACEFLDDIFFQKAIAEIDTSMQLAKEKGPAPCFKTKKARKAFVEQPYMKRIFENMVPTRAESMKKQIIENGLRNSAFNTIGPTGTVSIINDNCTSGVEPLFAIKYTRKSRIQDANNSEIYHYPLLKYGGSKVVNLSSEEIERKFNYIESHKLSYRDRIRIQSTIQKWIDASISSTINLSNSSTIQEIANIYMQSYESSLKGVTIYRDGSKNVSVLSQGEDSSKESGILNQETISRHLDAVKEKMKGNQRAYRVIQRWKGIKIYVTITVDENDRPFEVFTHLPYEAGVVDGHYYPELFMERNSTWTAVTRMVSLALRTNVSLDHVTKQLQKSSTSISELPAILLRSLKPFLEDSEEKIKQVKETGTGGDYCPECDTYNIIHQSGCSICLNCGYDKCG